MSLQGLKLSERSKAENLFLEADGGDFGSSNEFPQGNKLGTFCGTAPHAAGNSSRAKSTAALQCVCMAWRPSSTGRSAGPCLFMDRRQGDVGAGTEQSRHCSTCPRSVRPAHEMPYPHPQQERHFSRNHEHPRMNVGHEGELRPCAEPLPDREDP